MEVSFNDASLNELFTDEKTIEQGRETFEKFVKMLKMLKQNNLLKAFFIPETFFSMAIVQNYTVNDWLSDLKVNMNHKQFFRACLGKAVYIKSEQLNGEVKFHVLESQILSTGATFSIEHFDYPIIISVFMNDFWKYENITCLYNVLSDEAKLISKELSISNITHECEIAKLKVFQRNNVYDYVSSGQDLWEKRMILFPNLTFCESVKKQLYEDSEKYHILKIMERLEKMQEYFSVDNERYSSQDLGMNARTESETVKTNPELKRLRKFRLPSGEEEYFYDHISFSSGKYSAGRIHFLPDVDNNNCYIGYIGNHLPTKQF